MTDSKIKILFSYGYILMYGLKVMNAKDTSHLLPELAKSTLHHDTLRDENFVKVYPELDKLTGLSKPY